MAILFCMKVIDQGISGATTVYVAPELYRPLAQAEKFYAQYRVTQVTGTTPTCKVELETSNDGVGWSTKGVTPIIATTTLTPNIVNYNQGSDLGTATVGGCMIRLGVTLAGTNPNAYVEVWLTGRSND